MGLFDAGARPGASTEVTDRIWTVPNVITFLRLAGLPVFVWLLLGADARWAAFWVLAAVGATDWLDGYAARRLGQVSRLGKVMDPLVDRALLATAGIALAIDGAVPWWVIGAVVGRDLLLLAIAWWWFRGIPDIPVNRAGKTATACLLVGVPSFLLASIDWTGAGASEVLAWVAVAAGILGYLVAGLAYLAAARRLRAGA